LVENGKRKKEEGRIRLIYSVLANWISASRALSESLKDLRIFPSPCSSLLFVLLFRPNPIHKLSQVTTTKVT